ncbi:PH domain-containing protein [Staphylococcus warneri]
MGISLIRFFYVPVVNYHFLYYRIHHNILEVKSTFFFKRQDITKVERLQFLQIRTNPLAKLFKINEISFVSAGHSIELPFVSEKEAEYIEDQILSQLRGAEYDV